MNLPAASGGVSKKGFSDFIAASDGYKTPSFAINVVIVAQLLLGETTTKW